MYQTVISNTDGRTAVDGMGRSYFVAGSAHVMAGKKVWTDGKIIYGSLPASGAPFIPIPTGALIYVNHSKELFAIKGMEANKIGNARNFVIGNCKKCAMLENGKGYLLNGELVAEEHILHGKMLDSGEVLSVSVKTEECMTRYHYNNIYYSGEMPVMASFRARWDGTNYASDLLGVKAEYVYKPLILHTSNGKEIKIDYTEEYMALEDTDMNKFADGNIPTESWWLGSPYWQYKIPLESKVEIADCICREQGISLILKISHKIDARLKVMSTKSQTTYILDKNKKILKIIYKNIDGHGERVETRILNAGKPYEIIIEPGENMWSKSYVTREVTIKGTSLYQCIYDWDGQKLKCEKIYMDNSLSGHADGVYNVTILQNNVSRFVDGYEVIYRYYQHGHNIIMKASIQLDGFLWDSGLEIYVSSIRKHGEIYYVVVRNISSSNNFSHCVVAVSRERTVFIESLKEGITWNFESFQYMNYPVKVYSLYESERDYDSTKNISLHKCVPSTMFIPCLKSQERSQIMENEVDSN